MAIIIDPAIIAAITAPTLVASYDEAGQRVGITIADAAWPRIISLTNELLGGADPAFLRREQGLLMLTVDNGAAIYDILGETALGDALVAALQAGKVFA